MARGTVGYYVIIIVALIDVLIRCCSIIEPLPRVEQSVRQLAVIVRVLVYGRYNLDTLWLD